MPDRRFGQLPDGDDTGGASETVKPAACALDGHVGSPPNFFANPLATRQGLIGAVDWTLASLMVRREFRPKVSGPKSRRFRLVYT